MINISSIHYLTTFELHKVHICPEMQENEIHSAYDRHHKVSPIPNLHVNPSNSVKHEDIWKLHFIAKGPSILHFWTYVQETRFELAC